MIHLLEHHPAGLTIVGYWLFSAVVGGMPAPDGQAGPSYRWAYNSLHILAGNLAAAAVVRFGAIAVPAGTSLEDR